MRRGWLVAVPAVVGVAFLVTAFWPGGGHGQPVASPQELAAQRWRMSPENPANQPFPGPPEYLSVEQKRAVEAVTAPSSAAGALTKVMSVEKTTYNTVMCGRGFTHPVDHDVWLVWLKGPFRVRIFSVPAGTDNEFSRPDPKDLAFVVHSTEYYSEQSFSGWPIARVGSKNCPPEK